MASLNKSLSKFRQWQQDSELHIAPPNNEQHQCHCCNTNFTGNYCPRCGQKAGYKRITWSSIRIGVMDLWGMGTRSLPYTLWQLLLRPGYLIGDYISGRRQVSFPPIKMLVFVALFVYIIINLFFPNESKASENIGNEFIIFDYAFNFFEKHYDVAVMFFLSLLIIPTYFIFRFAPRFDHHTLPEGFFIQVFNSTIALLLVLILIILRIGTFDYNTIVFFLIVIFVVYRSYYQLFGYSHWSTLWRVITVFVSAVLTFSILVVIDYVISCVIHGKLDMALNKLVYRLIPYLLSIFVIIWVSYFISRRTAKSKTKINE